ncbi:MAG: DEAD/DEAH box helicase [Candidatus Heimdallarchaeota archaeon]
MEIISSREELSENAVVNELIRALEDHERDLELLNAIVYHNFPIYTDEDSNLFAAKILLLSPNYGVVSIWTSDISSSDDIDGLKKNFQDSDDIYHLLLSRLIRNRNLRKFFPNIEQIMNSIIFSPLLSNDPFEEESKIKLILNIKQLIEHLKEIKNEDTVQITPEAFSELIAVIEGSKALVRPKKRIARKSEPPSKGFIVNVLEAEIAKFDLKQKESYMKGVTGPQRIRGLAGSGKTVVLAIKAALTHLREPNAIIVYTYYTKSLHQHVKNLITRFYRLYTDNDPDWSKLFVMHAWGGYKVRGVYSDICEIHNTKRLNFAQASRVASKLNLDPFDYICRDLLKKEAELRKMYDYIFIDEGQDFSPSFIRLCANVTKNDRFAWAYDDLQTIFQTSAPTPGEIFGLDENQKPKKELRDDIVLFKCYRNPREILVCAHALGFGIYGERIVQMFENKEHWEDIGYKFISGEFEDGSMMEIERPKGNSLAVISDLSSKGEIVTAYAYGSLEEEVFAVVNQIEFNIREEELNSDDILVIVVDDRYARIYLEEIALELAKKDIRTNNVHIDDFGLKDFIKPDCVTLSTAFKAKGNESYCVYIVGVDSLYVPFPHVQKRNILFSAMTRAKGWVKISGVGEEAEKCKKEVETAISLFPLLKFQYPNPEELKVMKRDLEGEAAARMRAERELEKILKTIPGEEIKRFLDQRSSKLTKNTERE